MKTRNCLGAAFAVLAGTLSLSAQTADWTNTDGDRLWNNPLNWSTEAVPTADNAVTIGAIATPESPALLSGDEGASASLTLNSAGGSCLAISTDLAVGGTLLLANGQQGRIAQTAGTVTVTGALNVAYANWGKASLTVSGASSVFHARGANSVARWSGAEALIRIEDDATAIFENALNISGQWHATAPTEVMLEVLNGSFLHAKHDLGIGAGGLGFLTVSNAAVTVAGTWFTRARSISTFQDGAMLTCSIAGVGHYRDSNSTVIQEPGSTVVVRNGLYVSGQGQGGNNSATNNVYEIRGGLLIVTNGMLVANNGHGIFRQSGGVAEVRTGNIQVKTQTSTGSDLVLPISSLELSQDAVFSHLSGTFYLGDQYGSQPGIVAISGATPTMTVQTLQFRPGGILSPVVGPGGVAPLSVVGNATFSAGCTVLPEAMPDASTEEQVILTWGGTGTNPANLVLHPDANASGWKLTVEAANKRVLLERRIPATLLMLR